MGHSYIAASRPDSSLDAAADERLIRPAPASPASGAKPKRYLRILVVDDLVVNRKLLSAILASSGQSVTEAANGPEAIEAAASGPFDLILMDLHMPRMDGAAATRAIRAGAAANRATPILALTADTRPEQVAVCAEAGMDGYLTKPISLPELLATVDALDVPEDDDEA